jgi:hypothetical protein
MKRMVLLILSLLLLFDLAEDGCLGKVKFNLRDPLGYQDFSGEKLNSHSGGVLGLILPGSLLRCLRSI